MSDQPDAAQQSTPTDADREAARAATVAQTRALFEADQREGDQSHGERSHGNLWDGVLEKDAAGADAQADNDAVAATTVPTTRTGDAGTPPPRPPSADDTGDASGAIRAGGDSGNADSYDEDDPENHAMPLLDHLGELRRRLFRCLGAVLIGFFGCYAVAEPMFNEIIRPLQAVMPTGAHMIYTSLPEMFFLHMKLAFLAAIFVVSPYLFYQIWAFIAPGLYAHERKYAIPLAIVSALFFFLGAAFCYLVVLPFAFTFFLSYSTDIVVAMPDVGVYFSFVLKLILAFGLIFEMPLFALFLARFGLVTAAGMRRTRKYAILAIFIVAAILTPPDVLSQTLMSVPMLILYEISILVAAACARKPKTTATGTTTGTGDAPNDDAEAHPASPVSSRAPTGGGSA